MKIVCIASGESLTPEDVDYCKGKADKVYVVKESYRLAPWADLLYAADSDWWDIRKGCPDFTGEKWTCTPEAAKKWGINYIDYKVELKWSLQQGIVATGGNSGFQCVNLATLNGATEVILLGYDMGFTVKKHWWDDISELKRECRGSNYNDWIKRFHEAKPLIPAKVYNASRFSYLTCFEKVNLRDVL
jgi:hypothetical protein